MTEGFTAIIGAKISDFTRKMRQVDKQVRQAAMGATPNISADISAFVAKMRKIKAESKLVLKRDEKSIGADISNFMRKAAEVAVVARALTKDKVIVPIQARWKNYQNVMGRIASFNRAMGEIMQMTAQGLKISLSPAIVPIIASLVGLLGQLGPMLGTIGGSTFALGTAFATAGIGAAAFGAIATTNLKDVFKESKTAKTAMDNLKNTWAEITKSTKAQTVDMFTQALGILNGVLVKIAPMFTSVTDAVGRLVDSLGVSVKSESMTAFFDYLNKSAGPMLETIAKAIGNFGAGIASMMVVFGPLAESTSAGFLKMSASFATWAAKLGESVKFQAFVDYVKENMPKIKSIFGDAILGMVNTFAAFGPSSSEMMTGLQDMMARFKEWSSTLSENQGFQNFISYIKTNGPQVVSLIGNIVTFITNLGIALAPVGAFMLEMVNKFLEWSNAMLKNHPIIGKVVAAAVVLGGALLALAPHILGVQALFSGLLLPMATAAARMVATSVTFIARWTLMAAQSLAQATRMAAAWFIALGPIGWVTGAIIALAVLVIANWDKIKSATSKIWTSISTAVKVAWTAVKQKTVEAVTALAVNIAKMPGKVTEFKGKMLSAGKDLVMGLINGITGMAKEAIGAITGVVNGVINKAKSLLDINSPSRVFAAIGANSSEGLGVGVSRTATSPLSNKVSTMIGSLIPDLGLTNEYEGAMI